MKTLKITYWTTTVLIALMMLLSGTMYFTAPEMAENFHKLGFPDFFRVELGIAKIIGALLLLLKVPVRFKEWAYFGFLVTFGSAVAAHLSVGDTNLIAIIVAFLLLSISYVTFHKIQQKQVTAK